MMSLENLKSKVKFTLGFEDDDGFLENSLCYLIPKSTKFLDDF